MPASLFTPNLVSVASAGAYGFGDSLAIALSEAANDQLTNFKNIAGLNKSAESIAALTGNAAAADTYKEMGRGLLLSGGDPLKVQEMMFKVAMEDKNSRDQIDMMRRQFGMRDTLDARNTMRDIYRDRATPRSGSAPKRTWNPAKLQWEEAGATADGQMPSVSPGDFPSLVPDLFGDDNAFAGVRNPPPGQESVANGGVVPTDEVLPSLGDAEQPQMPITDVSPVGPAPQQAQAPDAPSPQQAPAPQQAQSGLPLTEARIHRKLYEESKSMREFEEKAQDWAVANLPEGAHAPFIENAKKSYTDWSGDELKKKDQILQEEAAERAKETHERRADNDRLKQEYYEARKSKDEARMKAAGSKLKSRINAQAADLSNTIKKGVSDASSRAALSSAMNVFRKETGRNDPNVIVKASDAVAWFLDGGMDNHLTVGGGTALDAKQAEAMRGLKNQVAKAATYLQEAEREAQIFDQTDIEFIDDGRKWALATQVKKLEETYDLYFGQRPQLYFNLDPNPERTPPGSPAAQGAPAAAPPVQKRLGVPSGLLPSR